MQHAAPRHMPNQRAGDPAHLQRMLALQLYLQQLVHRVLQLLLHAPAVVVAVAVAVVAVVVVDLKIIQKDLV